MSRALSRIFRCLETAASDIRNGFASSVTVRSRLDTFFKISRLVGSDKAWKIRLRSCRADSTIRLNLAQCPGGVNRMVKCKLSGLGSFVAWPEDGGHGDRGSGVMGRSALKM